MLKLPNAAAAAWSVVAGLVAASAQLLAPAPAMAAADATVGVIYPQGSSVHTCSGSVVTSNHRDLVLTAAHCVSSATIGANFVPGYDKAHAPYGVWTVTAVTVPSQWTQSHDPHYDFAYLRVAAKTVNGRTVHVQDIVSGHPVASRSATGLTVTMSGYAKGTDDSRISCVVKVTSTGGWPTAACKGFPDGTSGGPWIYAGWVVGSIGGYEQGGDTDDVSYSSPFGTNAKALLTVADTR